MKIVEQIKKMIREHGPRDDAEFLDYLAKILAFQGFKDAGQVVKWGFDNLSRLPIATEETFKQEPDKQGSDAHGMVFRTSGTTQKRRGIRRVRDYDLYRTSAREGFRLYCLHHPMPETFISLVPSASARPDSSLSHMATIVAGMFRQQAFFREKQAEIDHQGFQALLRDTFESVFIFATQADLNAVITKIQNSERSFKLPYGSRVMFTGGPKGAGNIVGPKELISMVSSLFGVHDTIQEFGMTELFSQSYDIGDNRFRTVPWLRTLVVSPVDMKVVKPGEQGLLMHIDLANVLSKPVILSHDIAIATSDGFIPVKRAPDSPSRGCSQDAGA